MRLRQGPAEHGEILAEHEDETPVDGAVANDHAVAGNLGVVHAEVGAAVFDEHVPFFKAVCVQQHFDALAGGELALFMLRINAPLAAAQAGGFALFLKLFEDFFHGGFSFLKVREIEWRKRVAAGLIYPGLFRLMPALQRSAPAGGAQRWKAADALA